ncbi:kinase-like protein [Pluteus cervinus]|uniref:Kinase-like protein n=1 Tax=Pluteus cervinus TaxID=181527 RepID=A0ACD3B163_9AGAR|nr:kinase-like protein [Pluteus cervinus]
MLDEGVSFEEDNTSYIFPKGGDMSYNIEHITDIKEFDSQWLDSDVEEILIMSRKPSEKLPTIVEDASEGSPHSPQLPRTLQDFDIIDVGPSLAFGSTLCRRRDTTKLYEMRRYPARDVQERKQQRILEIISQLRSPFLPHIHATFRENGDFHYVLDWHAGPSLSTLVSSSGPIESERAALFVDALHHLHGAKIVHRSLSADCVTLTALGHIILTDFRRASCFTTSPVSYEPVDSISGSCRAPEVTLGWKHEYAVDCWNLGVVMYYMLSGKVN